MNRVQYEVRHMNHLIDLFLLSSNAVRRRHEPFETVSMADAVIYDKTTKRAFVPSAIDGLLTVLAVDGPRDVHVLEQVPTQIGTRTGAIDPKTGTLYLPTARFGPLNKLGWPEALPGTVQLLVMRPRDAG